MKRLRRRRFLDKDITKQALTILVFLAVALSLVVVGLGIYMLGDSSSMNQGGQIVGNIVKEVPNFTQELINQVIEKVRRLF